MGARAFEGLKLRNGLLRELGPVQVLGVRCGGQLLLGDESSTHWVFCQGGGLWVEPRGGARYLLQPGMYGVVPGQAGVWPERTDDLSCAGVVIGLSGWLLNRAGMPAQVRKVAPGFNKAWVPGRR